MALSSSTIATLHSVLESYLAGRASTLLMTRLNRALDDANTSGEGIEQLAQRIRIAVRMFVDEKLADEVAAALRAHKDSSGTRQ